MSKLYSTFRVLKHETEAGYVIGFRVWRDGEEWGGGRSTLAILTYVEAVKACWKARGIYHRTRCYPNFCVPWMNW